MGKVAQYAGVVALGISATLGPGASYAEDQKARATCPQFLLNLGLDAVVDNPTFSHGAEYLLERFSETGGAECLDSHATLLRSRGRYLLDIGHGLTGRAILNDAVDSYKKLLEQDSVVQCGPVMHRTLRDIFSIYMTLASSQMKSEHPVPARQNMLYAKEAVQDALECDIPQREREVFERELENLEQMIEEVGDTRDSDLDRTMLAATH